MGKVIVGKPLDRAHLPLCWYSLAVDSSREVENYIYECPQLHLEAGLFRSCQSRRPAQQMFSTKILIFQICRDTSALRQPIAIAALGHIAQMRRCTSMISFVYLVYIDALDPWLDDLFNAMCVNKRVQSSVSPVALHKASFRNELYFFYSQL